LFQQEQLVWSNLSLEYGGFAFQYLIAGLVLNPDVQFGYAALVLAEVTAASAVMVSPVISAYDFTIASVINISRRVFWSTFNFY
tara:strand:+ start:429 stop:680 length:252 start_codon:yes stop_codon:yes gene_type:complete